MLTLGCMDMLAAQEEGKLVVARMAYLACSGENAGCLLWATSSICRMPAGIFHPHLHNKGVTIADLMHQHMRMLA